MQKRYMFRGVRPLTRFAAYMERTFSTRHPNRLYIGAEVQRDPRIAPKDANEAALNESVDMSNQAGKPHLSVLSENPDNNTFTHHGILTSKPETVGLDPKTGTSRVVSAAKISEHRFDGKAVPQFLTKAYETVIPIGGPYTIKPHLGATKHVQKKDVQETIDKIAQDITFVKKIIK